MEHGHKSSSETAGGEFSSVLSFLIVVASEGSSEKGEREDSRFEMTLKWTGVDISGDEEPEATGDVFADR